MNKQHQLNTAIASRSIKIAMLAMGIALGAAGSAAAAPIIHPVTKCGMILSTAGFYRVSSSLSLAAGATTNYCIEITGSNVTLEIHNSNSGGTPCDSTSLTGTGKTGTVGILIASSAKNTFIQGEDSNIIDFDYGIEDKGTATTGDDFNSTANVTTGLELAGTGGSFSNFFSGILQDGTGGTCSFSATQDYGVFLFDTTGSQIFNAIVSGNNIGVAESGATSSTVALLLSGGNEYGYTFNAGSGNFIYDDLAGVDSNVGLPGNTKDGFNIGSDTKDLITDNTASGNTGSDMNTNGDPCVANTYWFNFAANPSNVCVNVP